MQSIIPDKKVAKINVTVDDDINLILDAVIKAKQAYVMLIIPRGNDLINSPIGLKALRKKTLEKGKRIVMVVPKGIYHELATEAGFTATTTQDAVSGDVWQTVETQYQEYKQSQAGMPSKMKSKKESAADVASSKKAIEYISKESSKKMSDAPPEIISSTKTIKNPGVQSSKDVKIDSKVEAPEIPSDKKGINPETEKAIGPNVTGMDFSKLMRAGKAAPLFTKKTKPLTVNPKKAEEAAQKQESARKTLDLDALPKKIGQTVAKLSNKKKKERGPFAKLMGIAGIGAFILFAGVFVMYYLYFPGVQIKIYPQSYSLEVEDSVLATSGQSGFDTNLMEINMRKEKIPKSGVRDFEAKEDGVDGTKATGQVQMWNKGADAVVIPVNTKFALDGKNFVTTAEVSVTAGGVQSVQATAVDFGNEYNIGPSEGAVGDVVGFPDVKPQNTTSFTGGEKREFKVVGKDEVDNAVKKLKEELEAQALGDLEFTNLDNGYEFIRESVNTKVVDGSKKVNPAIGTEVKETDEVPTVTIETETTGLYYHYDSLEALAEKMLIEKYLREKELDISDIENTVIENLEVTVTKIELGKDDKVTVYFDATGLATYRYDDAQIKQAVVGKKPEELADYVARLPGGFAQAPDIYYTPSWIPEFMRYVPKETSRIDVRLEVVQTEAPKTEE